MCVLAMDASKKGGGDSFPEKGMGAAIGGARPRIRIPPHRPGIRVMDVFSWGSFDPAGAAFFSAFGAVVSGKPEVLAKPTKFLEKK